MVQVDFLPVSSLVVIGVLVVLMGLALIWQRLGLSGQQHALSKVDEGLELSRRAIRLQEDANALLEEIAKNQRDMIQVLQRPGAGGASQHGIRT